MINKTSTLLKTFTQGEYSLDCFSSIKLSSTCVQGNFQYIG
jgi:hypothetical protein